jgi:arginyl-tRNA--protein-N-Asp/Glu arginylyltransferase
VNFGETGMNVNSLQNPPNSLYSLPMLVQTAHLDGVTSEEYDNLLARGWFRSTGIIYKSEIVCMNEAVFSVEHIRIAMQRNVLKKRHRKLLRQNDARFRVVVGRPYTDERLEELYSAQVSRFRAFVHRSLKDIIHDDSHLGRFSTKQLSVYEGQKLIAVSYFDLGKKAMASIMCLFDPEYHKCSLGIYTMLKEMEYGLGRGVEYYYPGYVLDKPSPFDYKLTVGDCEWMDTNAVWYEKDDRPVSQTKGELIRSKISALRADLSEMGIETTLKIYPYFTIGQVMRNNKKLLNMPCYIRFMYQDRLYAASYDTELDEYFVFKPAEAKELDFVQQLILSNDYENGEAYDLRVIKTMSRMHLDEWLSKVRSTPENSAVNELF